MAFDISADNLRDEIREAEEVRDDFLGVDYEDKISRYVGPGYRRNKKRSEVDFVNHSMEWISLFLPLLASGNPRVKAHSPRLGVAQQMTKATEMAVNRNFQLTNIKTTIEKLAVDFAFKWCCAITLPKPQPGMMQAEDPPHRPVTKRISPTEYLWDVAASEWENCRFQGHLLRRDKEDLLEEAKKYPERGWNADVIENMAEDQTYNENKRKRDINVRRGEIEFYEILVHEHTLNKAKGRKGKSFKPRPRNGYNGTLISVPSTYQYGGKGDAKPNYIRDPRPFFGPRAGPYSFGGYLIVPDEVIPLSPLAAVEAQAEELNNMRMSVSAAMEHYKRGIAVDSMAGADVAEKIKEFEDMWVFVMDNVSELDKHIKQIDLAGATPLHFQQIQFLQDSLDRASGMTEAQRGQVSGSATATEASIAQRSSGQRMGYMTEKFLTSTVKPIAEKEAWYLAMHPDSRIHLGQDSAGMFTDPETGEVIEQAVEFVGSDENLEFLEDMDIQLDAVSMRYSSEALEAERSAKKDAVVQSLIPMIPQTPYWDWPTHLTEIGEEIGDPAFAKRLDLNKANKLGMLMMGANLSGPHQGSSSPQPRLSVDISSRLKASETDGGFSANARPQPNKAPRSGGEGSTTRATSTGASGKPITVKQ